jgi:hypothetical protein
MKCFPYRSDGGVKNKKKIRDFYDVQKKKKREFVASRGQEVEGEKKKIK